LRAKIELNRATGGASCTFAAEPIITYKVFRSEVTVCVCALLAISSPIGQLPK
jgi:hypothetical protein